MQLSKPITLRTGLILLTFLWVTCSSKESNTSDEELATAHCGGCHLFPDPALLDKETWNRKVMPHMALRMGIVPANAGQQEIQAAYFHLTEHGLFPEKPVVSKEEWAAIQDYFSTNAPDQLDQPLHHLDSLEYFKIISNTELQTRGIPAATHVGFDPYTQQFLAASFGRQKIDFIEVDPGRTAINSGPKIVSDILPLGNGGPGQSKYLVTYLGQMIRPDAGANGLLTEITVEAGKITDLKPLKLPALHRPVKALYTELNGSPGDELLICEFGYLTGKLSFWEKEENGHYNETVILNEPGAIEVESRDFTGDGMNDIMVLMAHGNERISLLVNQGNGHFDERVLIRFPPVYGSTGFELTDFNGDQQLDIVYTCGDNADISVINKPYHGIYLYQNKGNFIYEQVFHYPMPGAYAAVSRDFDLDGDIDLAAVAFFVDDVLPLRFVLLEQQPDLQFRVLSNVVNTVGRLIDIEAADIDRDGDQDIIVGNGYGLTGLDLIDRKSEAGGPSWILMENLTRSNVAGNKAHDHAQ